MNLSKRNVLHCVYGLYIVICSVGGLLKTPIFNVNDLFFIEYMAFVLVCNAVFPFLVYYFDDKRVFNLFAIALMIFYPTFSALGLFILFKVRQFLIYGEGKIF